MRYKPFIEVETFNDFKELKLSSDSTNTAYVTYESEVQTFGTPDVLWNQIVFVLDNGIIYSKGKIFTDIENTLTTQDLKTINSYNIIGNGNIDILPSSLLLSYDYAPSDLLNSYLSINGGDNIELAISKLEKAIINDEKITASSINDLNDRLTYLSDKPEIELVQSDWNEDDTNSYAYILNKPTAYNLLLSENYEMPYLSNSYLYINPKDNIELAIGKLEKAISYNEINMASGFVDLYDRMGILESTTASYISNYLNNVKNYEDGSKVELIRSDWNESNPLSYAYIENKPEIPTIPTLSKQGSGVGNAITDISINNYKITYIKGSTFLTEHQSIKTINNQSIVGSGNVTLSGLPEVNSSYNGKILMVVNGQWAMISPSTFYSGSGIPNDINGNNGDIYVQY